MTNAQAKSRLLPMQAALQQRLWAMTQRDGDHDARAI